MLVQLKRKQQKRYKQREGDQKSIKCKVDVDSLLYLLPEYISSFKRLYHFEHLPKMAPTGVTGKLRRSPSYDYTWSRIGVLF